MSTAPCRSPAKAGAQERREALSVATKELRLAPAWTLAFAGERGAR
jgi:hypothetical protein